MTPEERRRAWYREEAERWGLSAILRCDSLIEIENGGPRWAGKLAAHFGRLALGGPDSRLGQAMIHLSMKRMEEAEAQRDALQAQVEQLQAQRNQLHEQLSYRDLQASGGLFPEASLSEALPACPQWQPIETAPKDGRSILLLNGDQVSYGGWISAADQGADVGEEYLIAAGWWSVDLSDNDPTHWMPLPTPPVPPSTVKGLQA